MKKLPMVTLPIMTLRDRSRELTKEEIQAPEMQAFFLAMVPHMYEHDGIGLAAPQVGQNIRACIIGKSALDATDRPHSAKTDSDEKKDLVLVNPVYQKLSKKMTEDTEGCLSVPGFYGKVKRYKEIYVSALDAHGNPIEFAAYDFFLE
jgi:peptide deformylase